MSASDVSMNKIDAPTMHEYNQSILCRRYGREDEEVMGLRFCNEAVMCLKQIYPQIADNHEKEELTPLQVINCNLRYQNAIAGTPFHKQSHKKQ